MAIMSKEIIAYLNKMEKKYPAVFQHRYSNFLAQVCQSVEQVGENNRVYMTLNPQDLTVKIHDPVYETQIYFLRGEAYKCVEDEVNYLIATLKLQEIIEDEMFKEGGGNNDDVNR